MARVHVPGLLARLTVLLSVVALAASEVKLSLIKPSPQCAAFTPSYLTSLPEYNANDRVSLGVGTQNPGSYAEAWTKTWTGQGNSDSIYYGQCCDSCAKNSNCVGYSISLSSTSNVGTNAVVKYKCSIWFSYSLKKENPWKSSSSSGGVTYYPAAFSRPPPPPPPPSPPPSSPPPPPSCVDDEPAAYVSACPAWSVDSGLGPDESGDTSFPQLAGATADNFVQLAGGAVVKGRLLGLTGDAIEVFPVPLPNRSAQQCVADAFNLNNGANYFTWESCSKTCYVFYDTACAFPRQPTCGLSPSATAFTGVLLR